MNYLRSLFIAISILCLSNSLLQAQLTALTLTQRQLYDLELLLVGGFAPLTGFMNRADYDSVVETMRLADGHVWPMPITLDITEHDAQQLQSGNTLFLKSPDGTTLAQLTVQDIWQPDKEKEAQHVFGTTSTDHPGVAYLYNTTKEYYIGGTVTAIQVPKHYDFTELRATPQEVKELINRSGYKNIVAFQTRNPMHRAHFELTLRAAQLHDAFLLLHPVVGPTKPGDIDYITRTHCYKHIIKKYPEGRATLKLLPLAMRMAGPREALWHACIRKNYGATHFIVGRDHAGPGTDRNGNNFYGPYDAQELVARYTDEIGIVMVPFQEMVYLHDEDRYCPQDQVPQGARIGAISGTQLRRALQEGTELPSWFTFPEIMQELRKNYPPKKKQGITLFFTGLSGAGKSTIAQALVAKLQELQDRKITFLDGDIVRQNLSKGLGFSKEDRSTNVRRVGFVANEITRHGGIVICALIAPYQEDRDYNRALINASGNYIEIYVATPLEVCQERDPKGLYASLQKRSIKNFTGVSDPYEIPTNAHITLATVDTNIEQEVEIILAYLRTHGYI